MLYIKTDCDMVSEWQWEPAGSACTKLSGVGLPNFYAYHTRVMFRYEHSYQLGVSMCNLHIGAFSISK